MIAQSLFHFTSNINNIKAILETRRLRASYNIEPIHHFYPGEQFVAIPMVCFCDIPLKHINDSHTERYGFFGLGFSKTWAIEQKISPVMYHTRGCLTEKAYNEFIKETKNTVNRIIELMPETPVSSDKHNLKLETILHSNTTILDNALKVATHFKQYNDSDNQEKINYVDREWRWVPESELIFCRNNTLETRSKINTGYHESEPENITFNYNDLKYIVVGEGDNIADTIEIISSLEISPEERNKLIQKIIDIDSINRDM